MIDEQSFPQLEELGDPQSRLCPPPSKPCSPTQKFPENNRENSNLLFVNNSLLLKIFPLVNLLKKTLTNARPSSWKSCGYKCGQNSISMKNFEHNFIQKIDQVDKCASENRLIGSLRLTFSVNYCILIEIRKEFFDLIG